MALKRVVVAGWRVALVARSLELLAPDARSVCGRRRHVRRSWSRPYVVFSVSERKNEWVVWFKIVVVVII